MIYDSNIQRIFMMALCAWREARGESEEAWIAVMFTIKERADNALKWEGTTIVGAITKPWQYSSISDPRDKQLILFPQEGDLKFYRMMELADQVISNVIANPVPGADSYYDLSIHTPAWATPDKFVKAIGRLRFYRVL